MLNSENIEPVVPEVVEFQLSEDIIQSVSQ